MEKHLLLQKLQSFTPDWIQKPDVSLSNAGMLQFILNQVLAGYLEIKIEHLDADKIVGSIPYKHKSANVVGLMHGGTIFLTGDTLAGAFLWANSDADTYAVTTRSEIKYMKAVKEGRMLCTVTQKFREGRKVVLEAIFTNEANQIVGTMTVDYLLMKADAKM
jgi:uncharacterized protein (TIGR00369 family)